jgi:hypothetical protein
MTLRFDQFRRLRLLEPLGVVGPLPDVPQAEVLAQRPALPYRVHLKGGDTVDGLTVGHVETPAGLFVFEPMDHAGLVRRAFYPRAAYEDARIGPLLGEALVAQRAATAEQVQEALAEQEQLRSQRLGDMLVLRQIITPEELAEAIDQQAKMPLVRIGEALVALGLIGEQALQEALVQQRRDRGVALGELLVRKGSITREDLQTALARKMGYPLVDVTQFPCDAQALARLPYAVAIKEPALPLMLHGGRLVVALEDPSRRRTVDELEFAAETKVVPVLARAGMLAGAVDRHYEKIGGIDFRQRPGGGHGMMFEFEPEDAGKLLASLELQQGIDTRTTDDDESSIEQSDNSLCA